MHVYIYIYDTCRLISASKYWASHTHIYTHIYTHAYTYMRLQINSYIYACIYVYIWYIPVNLCLEIPSVTFTYIHMDMYICIRIYCIHIYIHAYTCMYTRIHIYMRADECIHICMYIYIYDTCHLISASKYRAVYTHIYTCKYTHAYTYMRVQINWYIYACIYMYIYTIHTG